MVTVLMQAKRQKKKKLKNRLQQTSEQSTNQLQWSLFSETVQIAYTTFPQIKMECTLEMIEP